MQIPAPTPIPQPQPAAVLGAGQVIAGAPIAPVRRLRIMESGEWEEFIAEWVDSLRQSGAYVEVQRCGGAGDFGRDVIGFKGALGSNAAWDNYQCKHYSKPLSVADVVAELGKLLYYVSEGAFTPPDKCSFVSPQGPSTQLLKCLENSQLKAELLARWDTLCKSGITTTKEIELTDEIRRVIEEFDFSTVVVLSPLHIIAGHRQTPYHVIRFGGGLPNRAIPAPPPVYVQPDELEYIARLLEAYSDELAVDVQDIGALSASSQPLSNHLQRSREHFYSAESLRAFSRDTVPQGTFEALQQEIFDGVQDTYSEQHQTGFRRVVETIKAARQLQITGNPLTGVMYTNDRAGACHQLANDGRMTWVDRKEPQ